ncbi:MAG: hypothetical protein JWP83_4920 [Mycobacterium sp.]|nr:hypothetical protein [Mycobacterium sp.]
MGSTAARDQLRPDVHRPWLGADAGRRDGLGRTGRRAAFGGGPGRRERIGAPTTTGKAAPPEAPAGGPITRVAAELRELASLRDSGILTDQEFTEQKRKLLDQIP